MILIQWIKPFINIKARLLIGRDALMANHGVLDRLTGAFLRTSQVAAKSLSQKITAMSQ